MSYHRLDQAKYVESGKVLEKETLEMLTVYFQAIHNQKVSDGTLQQQLKELTKQADKRHDRHKDRGSNNRHSTSRHHDDRRNQKYDCDRDRGHGREHHRDHCDSRRWDYDSHRLQEKDKAALARRQQSQNPLQTRAQSTPVMAIQRAILGLSVP